MGKIFAESEFRMAPKPKGTQTKQAADFEERIQIRP
jgi:hypothetical protein